jgi:AraC family ethanolamine operon transcriptional activator
MDRWTDSDPTAVGQSIEVIEQDEVQLESKPLRVRRVVVRLGSALVMFHSTNLAVRTRTKLHVDFVAYTAFAPKAIGTVNGLPIGPDRVLASMPGIEVEIVVAAGNESIAFLISPEDIHAHLQGRQRENKFRLPDGVELLTPSPTAARGLYRWGRRFIDLAARQPDLFDIPQTQFAAKGDLLENLLATLRSAVQVESAPRDLRLHRVRQTLREATHASTTVTKEALRWGFWHFGDFSRA